MGSEGQSGRAIVLQTPAGETVERLETDFNGEVLVTLTSHPHVFEHEQLVAHFDTSGLRCGQGAGRREIPLGDFLAQYSPRTLPGQTSLTGKGYGAACEASP